MTSGFFEFAILGAGLAGLGMASRLRAVRDGRVINNWIGAVENYKARTGRLDPEDFEVTA